MAPQQIISKFFSISFQPLAVEYILKKPVADLLNNGMMLSDDFWDSLLMIWLILMHSAKKLPIKLSHCFLITSISVRASVIARESWKMENSCMRKMLCGPLLKCLQCINLNELIIL